MQDKTEWLRRIRTKQENFSGETPVCEEAEEWK